MSEYDFSALYDQYSALIEQMKDTFDSHQFILELAHRNQVPYVEALYAYRDSLHRGEPTPFRIVHQILAQHLTTCTDLIERAGDVYSEDIFGQVSECAQWRKKDRV
ncbi:MAG: hypothetical protein JW934_06300 [Anaerolineae bacterium]|nr:hypothetical protein [Anaerolineae bacterium]